MTEPSAPLASPFGAPIRRLGDERLVTGHGRFVDDLRVPGLLHAVIVRSPHAHARIERIDAAAARGAPGVVAVLTLEELPECAGAVIPPLVPPTTFRAHAQPALAGPVVRCVGEAVAVVLAEDPYEAADAAEMVMVDYAVLEAAVAVDRALAPEAPRVFDGWPDNVAGVSASSIGDADGGFAGADVVVEATLVVPRVAPMPIEPRGVLALPAASDGLFTVWVSTQMPYAVRSAAARALGIGEERLRVIAPDVGGGFGGKGHVYPEDVLIPVAARRVGRPVKWIETRHEHLLAAAPDRDQRHVARLGVTREGRITAIETAFTRDHGAYPMLQDVISLNTINHLPGPYRVESYRATGTNVVTHKTFSAAYRGAGRPEAAFVVDRLIDRAARRIGMDAADLRMRNLIRPEDMPYRTGLTYRDGQPIVYDPADYPGAFARLLELFDYPRWRGERERRRGGLRRLGIGLSAYVEGTGIGPFEGADVRVDGSGTAYVLVGISSQGQAHETTLAQICAAALSMPVEQVQVLGGDTSVLRHGMGTIASRVAAVAGPAVARAARDVARK
ncbi:MAG TPA: xanthine dehydrogenase family protein molybdopterin-binding subunit, partial [Candidatus Limnocylindrales bacterium]|nr:xanthine dehydrogenase family protein molybdopterin-binding subunit [Candidatus Limnocylindrales bacterium]